MHHIHNTNAIVLSSHNSGEADKIINFLTADLGLIRVTAQGVRKQESKLQQAVQDFSLAEISLVCGRGGWRLVNAGVSKNFYYLLNSKQIKVISKIFSLIKRMIPEEETNKDIFHLIHKTLTFLEKKEHEFSLNYLEIGVVASILNELGYIDDLKLKDKSANNLLDLLTYAEAESKSLLEKINVAIRESHL